MEKTGTSGTLRAELIARQLARMYDAWEIEGLGQRLLCPLCWQLRPEPDFTLEHIVPKSLGARRLTVTCRDCNNKCGTECDSHVLNAFRFRAACRGHGSIRGRMRVAEHSAGIDLAFTPAKTTTHINVVGSTSNPAEVSAIQSSMDDQIPGEIHLNLLTGFNPHSLNRAYVKIAYLAMFELFGYGYARQPAVQLLRKRVAGEKGTCKWLKRHVWQLQETRFQRDVPFAVFRWAVGEVDAYCVVLRMRADSITEYRSVVMPGWNVSAREFFHALGVVTSQRSEANVSGPAFC